jgi:hypothetical protein
MTRDDVEKLLGGYATNTLTEQERKELFEAALADQTLFDALANEQAFKELLDDPRSRGRLIEVLQEKQPRRSGLHNIYVWLLRPSSVALAGSVAVALLAITLVIQLTGPVPEPQLPPVSKAPDRPATTSPSMPAEPSAPSPSAAPKLPAPSHEGGRSPAPKTATSSEAPVSPAAPLKEEDQSRTARTQSIPSAPPQAFPSLERSKSSEAEKGFAKKPLTQGVGENAPERQASEQKPEKFREEVRRLSPMAGGTTKSQALEKTAQPPLSIRSTILKQDREGTETEVDPSFVFRTEDKARLAIEPNEDGYLYVLARSVAGDSKLLFPLPGTIEANEKTARVEKKVRYIIPPIGAVTFAEPGDQRITVLFSRAPLPDLQSLIEEPPAEQAKTRTDGDRRAAKTVERIEITLKHQ